MIRKEYRVLYPYEEFVAECDACGIVFEDPHGHWSTFLNQDDLRDRATNSDWLITNDDKCYCPKCHYVDADNGKLVLLTPQP